MAHRSWMVRPVRGSRFVTEVTVLEMPPGKKLEDRGNKEEAKRKQRGDQVSVCVCVLCVCCVCQH